MFRTLTVTSPRPMQGPDVLWCQQLLVKNQWGDFKPGTPDRQYGPHTAAAVKRAQYWLGRKRGGIDGVYRQELHLQLAGQKKLTVAQRTRRKLRLRHKAQQPIGDQLIRVLAGYLGRKEEPAGSNNTIFTRAYMGNPDGKGWSARTPGPPWCAIFIWYGLRHLRFALDSSVNWAYVPSILAAARDGRAGLSTVPAPERGCLVAFDWDRDGIADHIGICTGVGSDSTFQTIEGNTSTTDDSNGGEVMRRLRDRSQVAGYIRIHRRR